jgi:hypothetical protein
MVLNSILILMLAAFSGLKVSENHTAAPVEINTPCDDIPDLNKKITSYVTANLRKKVGRGECWDLAAGALNTHNAKWNGKFTYGRSLDYKNECVYPGDILQFENVRIEATSATGRFVEEMPHHTAIVYEVHSTGYYTIAHQNYNNTRKVILTDLKMDNVKRGKVMMYRPQR